MKLAGATLCGHGEKASIFFRRAETVDHNRERESYQYQLIISSAEESRLIAREYL